MSVKLKNYFNRRYCFIVLVILHYIGLIFALPGYGATEDITYTYDDAGRLIEVAYNNGMKIEYVYDNNGNLLNRMVIEGTPIPSVTPSPPPSPTPTTTPTLPSGNIRRVPTDYTTIQAAINACVSGDTVLLSPGTYTGMNNKNLDFAGVNITLTSTKTLANTVIDCEGQGRAIYLHSGEGSSSVISQITIRNGLVPDDQYGAGILCENASPTIHDCKFENTMSLWHQALGGAGIMMRPGSSTITNCSFQWNNAAVAGGGIGVSGISSSLIVTGCSFIDNYGYNLFDHGGGGVSVWNNAQAQVSDCVFQDNEANMGGAVLAESGSTLVLTDCTIWGNIAHGAGGGVCCDESSCGTISHCLFVDNQAYQHGGGAECTGQSQMTVQDCLFKTNVCRFDGGGVSFSFQSSGAVYRSSFVDNFVELGNGGAIYITSSATEIFSCYITGNQARSEPQYEPSGGGIYASLSSNQSLELLNCAVLNNYADWHGGGIFVVYEGPFTMRNCTVAGNVTHAEAEGQGLYAGEDSNVDILNATFWNTDVPNDEIVVNGGNITINYSDIRGGWDGPGTNNFNRDPVFTTGPYGQYHLDGSSPCLNAGSEFAATICMPFPDGQICLNVMSTEFTLQPDLGIVDLGYHYPLVLPTPTPIITITPTPTPTANTPTPTPTNQTATPSPPQSTATSTPTWPCPETGVSLEMPATEFHTGDPCYLLASVCNQTGITISGYPLFVILDVFGSYWFAPSWISLEDGIDSYNQDFVVGLSSITVIPEFEWPGDVGSGSNIVFWGAMTDPGITELFGTYDYWTFGWSP